jgi:catechol 2,3-dioxygenase-like lactoylglutathione lyase family enzyme
MALLRMDHVGVVFEDLRTAIAFFTELGMKLEAQMPVSGRWVDQVVGLDSVRGEIAMMRTPDGSSGLELTWFETPAAIAVKPNPAPPNTLGLRRLMFAVTDIADMVARLGKHGGKLIGEIADYEDIYRLCYVRGPDGIIVALAQPLR